jgi:hypothetical protein
MSESAEFDRQRARAEARNALSLVLEILDGNAGGDFDSATGNSPDDLLYAVGEAREALDRLSAELREKPQSSAARIAPQGPPDA